jgi:DNA invertase Pin-like site-specific DNA recombinase
VDRLEGKGVTLRILNFGGDAVDTRGATGRLMLNMFAAMAQFEREMMLERQREGYREGKGARKVQKVANPRRERRRKMRFGYSERGRKSLTSPNSWGSVAAASIVRSQALRERELLRGIAHDDPPFDGAANRL